MTFDQYIHLITLLKNYEMNFLCHTRTGMLHIFGKDRSLDCYIDNYKGFDFDTVKEYIDYLRSVRR